MAEKKKRSPEELVDAIERMAETDLAERIAGMSEEEVDREIKEYGGDPGGIGARGEALVEQLARQGQGRLAAGVPRRQALLAILADAMHDAGKRAMIEEELGGKKVQDATEEELARVVGRIRRMHHVP